MKRLFLTTIVLALSCLVSLAQEEDPVLMVIAGEPVARSEFEYSFNKNNSEGVIDKKDLKEYVPLFVNYKLKVKAAQDAGIDTLVGFQKEFTTYRDQQIRPAFITDDEVEREAKNIYEETRQRVEDAGGIVKPAHLFIGLRQDADDKTVENARKKADSIWNVLKEADFDEALFGELVRKHSTDLGTRSRGGELAWIGRGQTLPAFDEKVFNMKVGETSSPVQTEDGFHIIRLIDKMGFFPYDSLRTSILTYIDRRGIRDKMINEKLDSIAKKRGGDVTPQQVLAEKREEMTAADPELAYLIKEYHDGLMLYEISNQRVWDYAEHDSVGLANYFKAHKKNYKWDAPRFKGIAYRTKDLADVENVKRAIEGVPYENWNETLRATFNNDSVLKIRAEKGIFKRGDNAIVDKYEFKEKDAEIKPMSGYDYYGTYGRIIKQPENYMDVKGLVVADYQEELEKAWIDDLRKTYPVTIDEVVLATVNKH